METQQLQKGGVLSMKSFRKEVWFNIPTRRAFVNITPEVEEALRESKIQEGIVLVKTKTN